MKEPIAVRVTVNGQPAFDGAVRKDVATLTRWAARDRDRTMLFGAELKIEVPKGSRLRAPGTEVLPP